MGIDGIGKGGPKLPTGAPASGTGKASKAEREFEVVRPTSESDVHEPAAASGASKATAASSPKSIGGVAANPLERLRSGQLDLDGYLDLKVEQATGELHGLSPAELDGIRKLLRDQLATDSTLKDLVKSATGAVPTIPEDG